MEMTGQRTLPVPPQQAWDALNDPVALQACIAGCESITLVAPDQYDLVMSARIGPVSARFRGKLTRTDAVEPVSYRIAFDGQGGAAGFGKGTADVRLAPVEAGTQLDYAVKANVGGKIAQIGSRLVDGAARKIADDFFAAFEARIVAQQAAAANGPATGVAPATTAADPVTGEPVAGTAPTATAGTAATIGTGAPAPSPAAPAPASGGWTRWAVAAAVAVAVGAWLLTR